MKHSSYPIHLNLAGRPVLVAGAGRVATRKIERLVEARAELLVVTLQASSVVQHLAGAARLRLQLRSALDDDTRDKLLVLCATNDTALNARLAAAARRHGALVSRVDAPEDSDFTVPAVARGENVEATVSTGGAAPSASRRLARELRAWVGRGPDRFAREMAWARIALRGHPDATERLRKLSGGPLFEACAADDERQIRSLMEAITAAEASS
jgi:uroporphyrin-III C-methyltransferase / precorrin-2 dehydrogenase / sirohydrochlorin ferrochelatase